VIRSERGQASVELVASVPFVLLAALVAWQLVLVGHVAWLTASAARSGARAALVGRDAGAAVRAALPEPLRGGARVRVGAGPAKRVEVAVPIPLVVYRWRTALRVSVSAGFGG
jgi:hypothetical protein